MTSKYRLSFGHIFVRLALTLLMIIIFGVAMLPFLRVANGLLYEQRAAIGAENMWRVVILWAIYTLIFSLFTFWKKRFRMVSILLMVCWILGTSLVLFIEFKDKSLPLQRCKRSFPYQNPKEVDRALDLISQRLDIENKADDYMRLAFDYRNCLNIQYSSGLNELEGAFLEGESTVDNLKINLKSDYKNFDDLTLATILVHELTHVRQFLNEVQSNNRINCFDAEAEAFTEQSIFLNQLNNEERRSIYSRINENIDINPAFQILVLVGKKTEDAYIACSKLKEENNLTQLQFNECVWTGTSNKMKIEVENSDYYKKQCLDN